MVDKIKEITQKIYNEGVIKAKEDADLIISEAKTKAEEIILSAKKTQLELMEDAKKQASEIKQKNEAEMQLAAQQFISQLKQRITTTINAKQVDDLVKKAFDDSDFVKQIILKIITNWSTNNSEELNLKLLLPEKSKNEFQDFFDKKAFIALNHEVLIQFDKKMENGFKIGPKDSSYIISFTDKDFENYFKNYLKDKTRKLLFESLEKE
jgi:V/A-type H+-transporting ATPase subunit E